MSSMSPYRAIQYNNPNIYDSKYVKDTPYNRMVQNANYQSSAAVPESLREQNRKAYYKNKKEWLGEKL